MLEIKKLSKLDDWVDLWLIYICFPNTNNLLRNLMAMHMQIIYLEKFEILKLGSPKVVIEIQLDIDNHFKQKERRLIFSMYLYPFKTNKNMNFSVWLISLSPSISSKQNWISTCHIQAPFNLRSISWIYSIFT